MQTTSLRESEVYELINRLLNQTLKTRKKVAVSDTLDEIHRFIILSHPVTQNQMYSTLLKSDSPGVFEMFFKGYHYASCHGYMHEVLQGALYAHQNKIWRNYIKQIITEECQPQPHSALLKEFMDDCGFGDFQPLAKNTFINNFIDAMKKGFSQNLAFALGYSLAIEIEGGYQIALIEAACQRMFPEQTQKTIWFQIHLDPTGEEEHAAFTVRTIESLVSTKDEYKQLYQGFKQACDDTYQFMNSYYEYISSSSINLV
ncbi:MAG: iron-containing redox enzyme family protein [Cyanobacteria bacterium P01_A01_bin.84]